MAHVYGHARPLWGIQQLKDFWKRPEHPWNAPVPKDYKGIYPTESQWEAQSGITADKWRQFRDVESRSGSRRPETDVQIMERLRKAQPSAEYGYPMALARDEWGMYGQAQKDVAAGKYAREEEEEDDMTKLLRYMFMSELMAGMAGGDPPTPYTVRAGPATRAFPTMPSMFG